MNTELVEEKSKKVSVYAPTNSLILISFWQVELLEVEVKRLREELKKEKDVS